MNALASLLAVVAVCLAAIVVFEVRPQSAIPSSPAVRLAQSATVPLARSPALDADYAGLAEAVLVRPLFSLTRRPPNVASPVSAAPSSATPLPRMTGILIDGPRRSAIFAVPSGKPTVVAEGGRIGPFTVETIEAQQVIVVGPDGKRAVRTSFDPTLQPPPAPLPNGPGAPQFPGIAPGFAFPGGPSLINPPKAPSAGYGLPQPAGAAR